MMNKESKNHWLDTASRYGAALAGLSLCGHATAGVVSLGSNFASVNYAGSEIVSLGIGSVLQFNDNLGKSIFARYSTTYGGLQSWGIKSLWMVSQSDILVHDFSVKGSAEYFDASKTGTQFFGFLTNDNQLGWFNVDFGGQGGDVVYLAGAYNDTPGENIHVGTVPLPASAGLMALGLLASGASGVRRLREQKTI